MTTPSEIVELRGLLESKIQMVDPGVWDDVVLDAKTASAIIAVLEGLQSEVERLNRQVLIATHRGSAVLAPIRTDVGLRAPTVGAPMPSVAAMDDSRTLRKAHDSATPVIEGVEDDYSSLRRQDAPLAPGGDVDASRQSGEGAE